VSRRSDRVARGGAVAVMLASAALGVTVTLASPAAAQDATAQAKALFNGGAQAYEAGQYQMAIQAFTAAYQLSPRPGILFSMAQAHKKQYTVGRQPAEIRQAIKLYREYIGKVEQGGRRGDAVQALAELEPIAEKLGADTGAAPAPAQAKASTWLMLSAQAKDAQISIDGGKPSPAPLNVEAKPGPHKVHVTAEGYFPEDRDVQAAEGGIVAVEIPLREQPAQLSVVTGDGADVSIDGRIAAQTPLARPIELPPGHHFVAVTRRGYRAFSEDLEVGRGEQKTLTVPLEVTGQRVAAYALIGVAAAGILTGGTLAVVAIVKQGQAESIDTTRTTVGGLTSAGFAQYNSLVSTRNDLRTAASVTLGGAALVGATGVLMAIFDQPVIGPGAHRDEPRKPAAPTRERPMEVSAVPIVAPGIVGAALHGTF
jgi:hypothetical protein